MLVHVDEGVFLAYYIVYASSHQAIVQLGTKFFYENELRSKLRMILLIIEISIRRTSPNIILRSII